MVLPREDAHKKVFFLVVRPLRGGGGGRETPLTTKQKPPFFINEIIEEKSEPLRSRGGGEGTHPLVVKPLKNHFF